MKEELEKNIKYYQRELKYFEKKRSEKRRELASIDMDITAIEEILICLLKEKNKLDK